MQRTTAALTLASAALVGCQTDPVAPPVPGAAAAPAARKAEGVVPGRYVPGRYLVVLRAAPGSDKAAARDGSGLDVRAVAEGKLAGGRGVLRLSYSRVLAGFAADLTDAGVAALRADPEVAAVEPDPVVRIAGVQTGAPWGLDRIDQSGLPLDGQFAYANNGAGVAVYILDSGIRADHQEFGGRAVGGRDFVTAGGSSADCHGHGTHVSGTVGGATYGVAKGARLVGVRVLDCAGNGSGSGLLGALDWVLQQHQADAGTPAVINMSLTAPASPAIDQAVRAAVAAGVTVAAAAGNAGADACSVSPARAPEVIAVGATGSDDALAGFSNHGACVDLLAPGVAVQSAGTGEPAAAAWMSGTSMASPHVAGAAALYLAANRSASPAQVAGALAANALRGAVQGLPAATTDRLLQIAFLGGATPGGRYDAALANGAAGLCMDVYGVSQALGAEVKTWGCWGGANQRWSLPASGTAGEVRVYGTRCLDALGAAGQAGDKLVIWECWGGANQQWTLTAAGALRGVNGYCVGPSTSAAHNGAQLVLQACDGSAAQRWTAVAAAQEGALRASRGGG